jgi:hypothetical protein
VRAVWLARCTLDLGPRGFAPMGPSLLSNKIGGLSVNIPNIVPMHCATECLPSAPGAIILERGTDRAMAHTPLRDQEGRQPAAAWRPSAQ